MRSGPIATREVLDAASAAIPVVLISGDLHSAWLNTAALRRFGHTDNRQVCSARKRRCR